MNRGAPRPWPASALLALGLYALAGLAAGLASGPVVEALRGSNLFAVLAVYAVLPLVPVVALAALRPRLGVAVAGAVVASLLQLTVFMVGFVLRGSFEPGGETVFVVLWCLVVLGWGPPLAAVLAAMGAVSLRLTLARRAGGRWCERCEYDLTGNTSGLCPECGEGVRQ